MPQGWSRCCLPDFTDVVMGQSPTSDTYNKNGDGIPFFQGKAEFGAIYPTVAKYCNAPNKIALPGATLLSVRAPVGPTNLAKEMCCIGRGLAAIQPVGGISPIFVLHLLRSIETDLSKEGTGSTFAAINKRFVEELEFGLPPLNEQHRIVAKI
ncbi:MAG: restriction endonuclease subunit S [Nitrosospira sp.]